MTTANMGLTQPGVTGSASPTPGPTWAAELNADLAIIDAHNHVPVGSGGAGGVQVPSAGIGINAALPMVNWPLTQIGWLQMPLIPVGKTGSQSGPTPTTVPTVTLALFTDGTDLWYKDGNGNLIQLTKNGAVSNTVQGTTIVNGTFSSFNVGETSVNHATGSPYTVLATDYMLVCDPTAGTITLNLPGSAAKGKRYEVADLTGQAATHSITVAANGADTILGLASLVLNNPYQSAVLTSDGSGHWMVS